MGGHNFGRVASTLRTGEGTTSDYSYFITRILGEATPKQARILGEGVTSNKMERVLYGKHV